MTLNTVFISVVNSNPAVEPNLGGIGNNWELRGTYVNRMGARWEPPASHEKPQTGRRPSRPNA